MLRWLTLGIVVVLAACGGGGGGPPTAVPTMNDYWPIEDVPEGTVYRFDVSKTVTVGMNSGTPEDDVRDFVVDHSPLGALTLTTITRIFGVGLGVPVLDDAGAGTVWTARGLEAVAYGAIDLSAQGGPCVTMVSPGVLVAPADLEEGEQHVCNLPGLNITQAGMSWIGAAPQPGYPDAQRVDFIVLAAYSGANHAPATQVRVSGVLFLAPGVGPVGGTVVQSFLESGNSIFSRSYEFTLTAVLAP